MVKRIGLALVGLGTGVAPAFAHLNPAEHGSFAAGFSHPLFGLDHILAMVAVGLWAALLARGTDRRAVWLVPAAFVGTMLAGFGAAMAGAPLPFVEPVIVASVVAIGLLAAIALSVPTVAAMAMVGFFAVFHGHAHGGELGEAGAWPFAIGFAAATALLHAAGVLFGIGLGGRYVAARTVGALTAAGGLWLAFAG
ncbi:MAG: HupE/UreJ family protein [Mesorhizobium sp.]|nr:HupE/UreJ family protein [Mesorhizobium sp.]